MIKLLNRHGNCKIPLKTFDCASRIPRLFANQYKNDLLNDGHILKNNVQNGSKRFYPELQTVQPNMTTVRHVYIHGVSITALNWNKPMSME